MLFAFCILVYVKSLDDFGSKLERNRFTRLQRALFLTSFP